MIPVTKYRKSFRKFFFYGIILNSVFLSIPSLAQESEPKVSSGILEKLLRNR